MLRIFFTIIITGAVTVLSVFGLRGTTSSERPIQLVPDMKTQPKQIAQHQFGLFADGRGDRLPVKGTLPVGYSLSGRYLQPGADNLSANSGFPSQPDYFSTGRVGEFYGDGSPVQISEKILKRGQERYNIYCTVCHDATGSGNGVTKSLGLITVASLIDDRIKAQPDGQIFNTITHGKNTMGAYGSMISVEDRWAIVSYVRALQIAAGVKVEDLPKEAADKLSSKK